MGEARTDRTSARQRRLLVRDAAPILGISDGAVRMRVKRGTLLSTHEGGRLYVLLERDPTTDPERVHDRDNDRTSELTATLRDRLEAERQAHAEAMRILAGLVERMPALEPPESPESAGEPRSGTERGPLAARRLLYSDVLAAFAAHTITNVRQLPEQWACCDRQIATLGTCVLPDGTRKRGVEVTFRESAEGGIRCTECAAGSRRP